MDAMAMSKINKINTQLAEKAAQADLNTTNANVAGKANQVDLNNGLAQKRDKSTLITMSDVAQDVKTAMTGSSVAVVSGDSVGTNNLTKIFAEKLGTYIDQSLTVTEGYKWDLATKVPIADASAHYAQVSCVSGDKFRLTTRGSQYMSRYVFVDASNNILASVTDASPVNHYDEEITAPSGAVTLIINSTTLLMPTLSKLSSSTLVEEVGTVIINQSASAISGISTTSRRFIYDKIPANSYVKQIQFYALASGATVTIEFWVYSAATGNIAVAKTITYTTVGTGLQTVDVYYKPTQDVYISFKNSTSAVGYVSSGKAYFTTNITDTSGIAFSSLGVAQNFSLSATVLYYKYQTALQVAKSLKNEIITVGINGDYQTIQEACNVAPDGSTILVYPGLYREQLSYYGKDLHIIGVNKHTCILIDSSSDYRTPPVEANMGSIQNMTIIEDALSPVEGLENVTYDNHPVKNMAYCIHSDSATGIDATKDIYFIIKNCILQNANRPCLGAGTYARQYLILDDVDIYSGVGVVEGYKRGAVYVHNNVNNNVSGQNFRMKNCRVHCADEKVLYINDTGATGGDFEAEFINNMVYSDVNGKSDSAVYSLLETTGDRFRISPKSYGNNVSLLNA